MEAFLIDEWLGLEEALLIADDAAVSAAREMARDVARAQQMSDVDGARLATIASELAYNQLRHARYGRIGSRGTMTIKDFPDEAAARKAMDKAIAEKVKKGYAEKGAVGETFQYDDVLVNGDDDAISEYIDGSDKCLVVDWREEEGDLLDQLIEILPEAKLSWEDAEEEEDMVVTFGGVRSRVGLTVSMRDRYILLKRLNQIMAGAYELRAFRCTLGSDTHCFYPRSVAWWSRMESLFPERIAEVFARITPEMDF